MLDFQPEVQWFNPGPCRRAVFLGPLHRSPVPRLAWLAGWILSWRWNCLRDSKHKNINSGSSFLQLWKLLFLHSFRFQKSFLIKTSKWQVRMMLISSSFDSNLRTWKIFIPVTGLACSYGKISSPVTQISVTGPARLLIWTHKNSYKGNSSEVRSR